MSLHRSGNRGDKGASLVIMLAVMGGVMVMLTSLLTYASTAISTEKHSADHVKANYNIDGTLKIAVNSVRAVSAYDSSGACKDFPRTITGLEVTCFTNGLSSSLSSSDSNPLGVTPDTVNGSLYPGQSVNINKTVKTEGYVITGMSGKNGCNFSAEKNSPAGTVFEFTTPPSPLINQANFRAEDVGQVIRVWENGSCVNGVGNGQGNTSIYTIASVVSPTKITLTKPFGGSGPSDVLKNYQWEVPMPSPVTVSATTNVGSSTCPSTLFEVTFSPSTTVTGYSGQTFNFTETIKVKSGVASTVLNHKYVCIVEFKQNGIASPECIETDTITVITETPVYFTAKDSSNQIVGQSKVIYLNTTTNRTPQIDTWAIR